MLWTGGSAVLLVGYLALSNPNANSWRENVAASLLMALLGIGVVKSIEIRPLLFRRRGAESAARPRSKVS